MSNVSLENTKPASSMKFGQLAAEYCKKNLPIAVLQSNAGFYIGTLDEDCPCSRESVEYFSTEAAAQKAFDNGSWTQRQHP